MFPRKFFIKKKARKITTLLRVENILNWGAIQYTARGHGFFEALRPVANLWPGNIDTGGERRRRRKPLVPPTFPLHKEATK